MPNNRRFGPLLLALSAALSLAACAHQAPAQPPRAGCIEDCMPLTLYLLEPGADGKQRVVQELNLPLLPSGR